MNINDCDCEGCNSENNRCTELYKKIDDSVYMCPCASCIVKMICKKICGAYIKHARIGVTNQWITKEWK